MSRLPESYHRLIQNVVKHSDRPSFPYWVSFLAALDTFVFVIPTDGIVITAFLAQRKKTVWILILAALGSTLGSTLFGLLTVWFGPQIIDWILSDAIQTSTVWTFSQAWFKSYGIWAVAAVSALPVTHHPILALVCLAKVPLLDLSLSMLAGRVLKFAVYAWICRRSPDLLAQFRPVREELEQVEQELHAKN
jgi:membrane protein YqaA with SNARE-associated domain